MHEFFLFGFVVREGNDLAEELFLFSVLDGHISQIFFFFFERKIN